MGEWGAVCGRENSREVSLQKGEEKGRRGRGRGRRKGGGKGQPVDSVQKSIEGHSSTCCMRENRESWKGARELNLQLCSRELGAHECSIDVQSTADVP